MAGVFPYEVWERVLGAYAVDLAVTLGVYTPDLAADLGVFAPNVPVHVKPATHFPYETYAEEIRRNIAAMRGAVEAVTTCRTFRAVLPRLLVRVFLARDNYAGAITVRGWLRSQRLFAFQFLGGRAALAWRVDCLCTEHPKPLIARREGDGPHLDLIAMNVADTFRAHLYDIMDARQIVVSHGTYLRPYVVAYADPRLFTHFHGCPLPEMDLYDDELARRAVDYLEASGSDAPFEPHARGHMMHYCVRVSRIDYLERHLNLRISVGWYAAEVGSWDVVWWDVERVGLTWSTFVGISRHGHAEQWKRMYSLHPNEVDKWWETFVHEAAHRGVATIQELHETFPDKRLDVDLTEFRGNEGDANAIELLLELGAKLPRAPTTLLKTLIGIGSTRLLIGKAKQFRKLKRATIRKILDRSYLIQNSRDVADEFWVAWKEAGGKD